MRIKESPLEGYKHLNRSAAAQNYAILITDFKCQTCGYSLRDTPIIHYPHSAGWSVDGYKNKQWLFIVCPKCGYENALWKLGVSRSADLKGEKIRDRLNKEIEKLREDAHKRLTTEKEHKQADELADVLLRAVKRNEKE